MAIKLVLVLAVAAVAFGSPANFQTRFASVQETKQVLADPPLHPTYSCAGKVDGDYDHPDKCDHFIACVDQTLAYEMPCAPMDDQGNLLYFVRGSGPNTNTSHCDWPALVQCDLTPSTEDAPIPTEATTPPGPTEVPTKAPVTGHTDAPRQCKELECHQSPGNKCTEYWICQNGTLTEATCKTDLFWSPGLNPYYGGGCDFWANLPADLQVRYEHDEDCIPPCKWWTEPETKCKGVYFFLEKFDGTEVNLEKRTHPHQCPRDERTGEQLVFDEAHDVLQCVHPKDAGCAV